MKTRKTAKATRCYSGTDTYGRYVDVACSEDGRWFVRFSDNGMKSAWQSTETPTHPTHTTNAYTGERIDYTPEEQLTMVQWGFNVLQRWSGEGLRLPKEVSK
jgi:hypothetical protein